MGSGVYARDRRDVGLDRRGLLAGLHLGTDKGANGVRIRRQKRLSNRLAVRLEYSPRPPSGRAAY